MTQAEQLVISEAKQFQRPQTPHDLLTIALNNNAAIDVIERLAALQEKADTKRAQQEYDLALAAAQSEVPSIKSNKDVPTKNGVKKFSYASYEALDKVLRPIYLRHGFSLSFKGGEAQQGRVRVICRCSHQGGHVETYEVSLPVEPGNAILSLTDSELASQSKAKRRLLRNIFNVVDDTEDEPGAFTELAERLEWIANCRNEAELATQFNKSFKDAKEVKDAKACLALVEARDKKRGEFRAHR